MLPILTHIPLSKFRRIGLPGKARQLQTQRGGVSHSNVRAREYRCASSRSLAEPEEDLGRSHPAPATAPVAVQGCCADAALRFSAVQGCGAETAVGLTNWCCCAGTAAGRRHSGCTVASGPTAVEPTPLPPARLHGRRSCRASRYLSRCSADAAAGRLLCTVASGPPAAPDTSSRSPRPAVIAVWGCGRGRRGRCCWAYLQAGGAALTQPPLLACCCSDPHPQAPMLNRAGGERQITDKEAQRSVNTPLQ